MIRRFYVTVNGRGYEVEIEEVATFPRPVAAAMELPVQSGPRLAAAPAALFAPPGQPAVPAPEPIQTPPAAAANPVKAELPPGGVAIAASPKAMLPAAAVVAPMPGKILSVKVTVGQAVKRGDVLMILEAMKMENEIQSPADGMVSAIAVESGQTVEAGVPLASIG